MNRVILTGNIGSRDQMRDVGESCVLRFRLATTTRWRNQGGDRAERTDWHNVTIWGGLARGLEKYLTVGRKVLVEGSIRVSTYEDASHGGLKRTRVEIVASSLELLGTPREAS